MNFNLSNSIDCTVRATDGDVGMVGQFYFDDLTWIMRYMSVKLKGGHPGRTVLIPLEALGIPDWEHRVIPVNRTMTQIFDSPTTDVDEPVPRQHEIDLYKYYAWPSYWAGNFYIPLGNEFAPYPTQSAETEEETSPTGMRKLEPNLRSTRDVVGCHIHVTDGSIGVVEDFLIDEKLWAIRYFVINVKSWLENRKILVSPNWITKVNWIEKKIFVDLLREAVKKSPHYDPSKPISLAYEGKLRDHLQKPEGKEWVLFKFHAPPKTKVYVAGTFNNWNPTAIKLGYHGKGTYSAMVLLPIGIFEYKFIVNGVWRNNPDCHDLVPNAFGSMNSRLVVSRTKVHEIHPHTFSRMPDSESHRLWSSSVNG